MEIITSKEQELLAIQSNRKDFYTNEYLNNPWNENFKIINDLFFDWDEERCTELNVWTNLFSTITDTISNFVWQPVMDIELNINNYINDLISVWQLCIWLNRNEQGEIEPYYIPAEDFIFTNKEYKVIKQYSEIEWDNIAYYILKQTYNIWETINELFKIQSANDINWEKVTLDTLPQTAHLKDIVRTWLDKPAIIITQIQSLLWKIKSMVYSLDRKAVMFEKQFLQDIDQYKIFNNVNISAYLDSRNRLDTTKIGKILVNNEGMDWEVKFISNQNPLVDDAIKYEQTQLRKISSATSLPLDFLWIQDWWAVSWTSRELIMQSFIKTIEKYRDIITEVLKELLELMEWQKNIEWEKISTNIIWNEILTKWDKQLIEELKIAREAWLISQYTWIKLYLWVQDQQAQEELDLILNTWNNETVWENEI